MSFNEEESKFKFKSLRVQMSEIGNFNEWPQKCRFELESQSIHDFHFIPMLDFTGDKDYGYSKLNNLD